MRLGYAGLGLLLLLSLAACGPSASDALAAAGAKWKRGDAPPFTITPVAVFDQPWAMCFLPDDRLLVTEKPGRLRLVSADGRIQQDVSGVPAVAYGGQGGFGDVILHPAFAQNRWVYLSYAEPGDAGRSGAAVARARLQIDEQGARLDELQVIWRQTPKVSGQGHYGHRLAFGPDGLLYLSAGDRQKLDPAQDLAQTLGKILRLRDDGSAPPDNPFAARGEPSAQIWSYGHRNPLGLAFDAKGQLWAHEMGPLGGDELNLIVKAGNYGWPLVSNGSHYDGRDIPDHATRTDLIAPQAFWNPVIAPAGFIIYSGSLFPDLRGNGLIGGLRSQALVRVALDGERAREVQRWDMGHRIREVEQGPDGAIWLLEDGRAPNGGRLLRLTPAS